MTVIQTTNAQEQGQGLILDEQMLQLREENEFCHQRIEKLSLLVQDQEKRIGELQHFEYGLKKHTEKFQEVEGILLSLQTSEERLQQECSEEKERSKQLERVIQFLRERLEGAQLETRQVKEDYQIALQSLVQKEEEFQVLEQRLNENEMRVQEEIQAKQDASEEVVALESQFTHLKTHIEALEQSQHSIQAEHEQAQSEITRLQALNDLTDQTWQKRQQEWTVLAGEVDSLKRALMLAIRNSEEWEMKYLHTVNEKVMIQGKSHQLQQHSEKLFEEIRLLRAQQQNLIAHQQTEESIENLREQLEVQQEQIIQLTQSAQEQESENRRLEEALSEAYQAQQEAENQLQNAHQHLAKKVKETSGLIEQIEGQNEKINELQNQLSTVQAKMTALQGNLEFQMQHEQRLQEQFKTTLMTTEGQIGKWERKYFEMHEKWQETERDCRELKAIKEHYKQLQVVLKPLAAIMQLPPGEALSETIFSKPVDTISASSPVFTAVQAEEDKEIPQEAAKLYQVSFDEVSHGRVEDTQQQLELFENASLSGRYRQNLFD